MIVNIIKLNNLNVARSLLSLINTKSIKYFYNNLTKADELFTEQLFTNYYEIKLNNRSIDTAKLILNGVERFSEDTDFTNKIVPYEYYNNMISGLQTFNFSLHPNEYQPSGYANFYLFKPEFKIILNNSMLNIPSDEVTMIYLCARSYNIMRFIGGIGGLAW